MKISRRQLRRLMMEQLTLDVRNKGGWEYWLTEDDDDDDGDPKNEMMGKEVGDDARSAMGGDTEAIPDVNEHLSRSALRDLIEEELAAIFIPDFEIEPAAVEDAWYPSDVVPHEDAWSGGDNLVDPLDHAHLETGESNAGPHLSLSAPGHDGCGCDDCLAGLECGCGD